MIVVEIQRGPTKIVTDRESPWTVQGNRRIAKKYGHGLGTIGG
jgi:hypothetical protein